MLNIRTKKKHLRNKEVKNTDSSNKRRKTTKKRFGTGGEGVLKATGQNALSVGKTAINTVANPLTSLRKGANYLKNKGKFALTYLVNTSDLDRMIYKNSNFIHLVPTEKLNNIYYENEEKSVSELGSAAKYARDSAIKLKEKTEMAINKGLTNIKEKGAAIATGAKELKEKTEMAINKGLTNIKEKGAAIATGARTAIGDIATNTGAVAKKLKDTGTEAFNKINPINQKNLETVKEGLNKARETGSKALTSLWDTINKAGEKNKFNKGDGRFEKIFASVGKKLDNAQFDLDYDQQPGLTKPAMKKQTWIEAAYDKSNVLNDVLRETLTAKTGYVNANVADVIGDYFREVEEDLALIRNNPSESKKRKRKKGKGQEKQKKFMAIENEISKEQKFEISKGLLELVHDLIPESESGNSLKHVLIFLNETNFNSRTMLENPGSQSKFHSRNDIKYVEESLGGSKKCTNKNKRKQKGGGDIQMNNGDIVRNIDKLFNTDVESSCTIANGSDGKVDLIMKDMKDKMEVENAFSVLFFDIGIWDTDVKQKMETIEAILKENGIIIGDPEFTFGEWKLTATFRLKGFDNDYGIFVKQKEDFNLINGLDMAKPMADKEGNKPILAKDNNEQTIRNTIEGIDTTNNGTDTTNNKNENVDTNNDLNDNKLAKNVDPNNDLLLGSNRGRDTTSDNENVDTNLNISNSQISLADKATETALSILKDVLEKIKKKNTNTIVEPKNVNDQNVNDQNVNDQNVNDQNVNDQINNTIVKSNNEQNDQNDNNPDNTSEIPNTNSNSNTNTNNTNLGNSLLAILPEDQIQAKDEIGYFTANSNGIVLGGALIPWSIFKFARSQSKYQKEKEKEKGKEKGKGKGKGKGKEKGEDLYPGLGLNKEGEEDMITLIEPLVIREKIKRNIKFLSLLDEIINQGTGKDLCENFEIEAKSGHLTTKGKCLSNYFKKIVLMLDTKKATKDNEIEKEIIKNNKKSSLYQRYNYRRQTKTESTNIDKKDKKGKKISSKAILERLKASDTIYGLYEGIQSFYSTLLEEINPSLDQDNISNSDTATTVVEPHQDLPNLSSDSGTDTESIQSYDTRIDEYFNTDTDSNRHIKDFQNATTSITKVIREMINQLEKLEKVNNPDIEIITTELQKYQPSPDDLKNTIIFKPRNPYSDIWKKREKKVQEQENKAKTVFKQGFKGINKDTTIPSKEPGKSPSKLFDSIENTITDIKKKLKLIKHKNNRFLKLLNSPPEKRNTGKFLPLTEKNLNKLQNKSNSVHNYEESEKTELRNNLSARSGTTDKIFDFNSTNGDIDVDMNSILTIPEQTGIILEDIKIFIDDTANTESSSEYDSDDFTSIVPVPGNR